MTKEAFILMWAQRDKLQEMPEREPRMTPENIRAKRNKTAYLQRNTGTLMWSEKLGKMVLRDE